MANEAAQKRLRHGALDDIVELQDQVAISAVGQMAVVSAHWKPNVQIGSFRFCPIPLNKSSFEVIAASGVGDRGHAGERRVASGC
jgi:hypothetical protein